MNNRVMVLIGCALLVVGLFLPIVDLPPPTGSLNLLLPNGGIGDGIFVLILAAAAAILALTGKIRHALWPGILALGFLVWKFFQVQESVTATRGALFEGDGGALIDSVGMNYLGWGVLLIGAIVTVVGGASAFRASGGTAPTI